MKRKEQKKILDYVEKIFQTSRPLDIKIRLQNLAIKHLDLIRPVKIVPVFCKTCSKDFFIMKKYILRKNAFCPYCGKKIKVLSKQY